MSDIFEQVELSSDLQAADQKISRVIICAIGDLLTYNEQKGRKKMRYSGFLNGAELRDQQT